MTHYQGLGHPPSGHRPACEVRPLRYMPAIGNAFLGGVAHVSAAVDEPARLGCPRCFLASARRHGLIARCGASTSTGLIMSLKEQVSSMLDGLDAIKWATLSHTYGDANDVPDQLRSLLSDDARVREEAISELYGNIWHQGTVYSATARAIPFLFELLAAPAVMDKPAIAHLLACIAAGRGYLEVHAVGKFGEPAWREILGKRGKSLEEEMVREAAEVQSVHRGCSAGLLCLVPFLSESEPEFRRAVAAALGCYPEHTEHTLPVLKAAASAETDEEVRGVAEKYCATKRSKVLNVICSTRCCSGLALRETAPGDAAL